MQRWLPALTLFAALLPPLAQAQAGTPPSPEDARNWLQRIHAAATSGNYRGTLVFSSGGSMSSSRVWHYCIGDQTWEKLEALDGRQRQVVRHNDDVHTIWPQARVSVIEKRDALPGWQVTPQSVDPRVLEQYQLLRDGASRVAGREADVLLLEPLDKLRYAQRLWVDRASGLMLRAEVLTPEPNRTVLESAAFSEVEIGVKPQPKSVMQVTQRAEGFRVMRPRQQRVALQEEGWVLARPVAGFKLTGGVKRELDNGQPGADGGSGAAPEPVLPVLQAVFSDGLAHVSLFIEPYDPRRHKREMQASLGATSTVTLRRDAHWFTAVGDTPAATLKLIAESLDRRR